MDRGWSVEGAAPADRRLGDLPPVQPGHARAPRPGPRQPPARPRPSVPGRGGDRPRHRAGGQRAAQPEAGRAQRLCPRARLPVPPARELCPLPLEGGDRPRPIPPRPLHLPQAVDALPDARDLRRAQRRRLVRPPPAVEHAVAGPDDPQRDGVRRVRAGPGAEGPGGRWPDRRRSGSPTPSAGSSAGRPRDDERTVLLELAGSADETDRRGPGEPAASWPPARARPPDLPAGVSPAQLAAYTVVSRVLLNLDETITKE